MHIYEFCQGTVPLLVSMPHIGTFIPEEIRATMSPAGRRVSDTDWDLDRLYDFLWSGEAHVICAKYSRYVIDLNRDPENRPLYAGVDHPGLVPTHAFDNIPLYHPDREPSQEDILVRRERYWRPYHDRVAAVLSNLRERYGVAILFDCHSMRSVVPRYMRGRIPDLNLGTADGASCADSLRASLAEALKLPGRYSCAIDGVFKGGYITRHYGRPSDGQHAFQLELSQATYMQEGPTPAFDTKLALELKPTLRAMIQAAIDWARDNTTDVATDEGSETTFNE